MIFKCDNCGQFVSPEKVNIKLITPDSYYTKETYETLCSKCKTK